jgi:cytochrome c oxidase subunit 1
LTAVGLRPVEELAVSVEREPETGLLRLVGTRDHKVIGMMIVGTALVLLLAFGALALVMRAQLSQPGLNVLTAKEYAEVFTMHGSGMIYLVITPIALGLGVYLVPLQVGAPFIAAPRVTLFGYWMYVFGALTMLCSFLVGNGAGSDGWYAYEPLSDSLYTPGKGMDLWPAGVFMTAIGMVLIAATILWTALRLRAPGMTLMRLPVFTWSQVVTCMMSVMAFPSLMAAMTLICIGRVDPGLMQGNAWTIGYQNIFWFYGHPVVYIMFFPFVGCVAEILACFQGASTRVTSSPCSPCSPSPACRWRCGATTCSPPAR